MGKLHAKPVDVVVVFMPEARSVFFTSSVTDRYQLHPQRCPGQIVRANSSGTLAEVSLVLPSPKTNGWNLKWLVSKKEHPLPGVMLRFCVSLPGVYF